MKLHLLLLLAILVVHPSYSKIIQVPIMREERESLPPADTLVNLRGSALPRSTTYTNSDVNYYSVFQIGDNKQSIKLQLDTGSSALWIIKPGGTANTNITTYDCSASKTCQQLTVPMSTNYADGDGYKGFQIMDTVKIGDALVSNFTIAYASSEVGAGSSYDGILGLGPKAPYVGIEMYPQKLKPKILDSSDFCIYLGSDLNNNNSPAGEISFGGCNPALAAGPFRYVSLIQNYKHWSVSFEGVSLGDVSLIKTSSTEAFFDTGATNLGIPSDLFADLITKLKCNYDTGYARYVCDCGLRTSSPPLSFKLGGRSDTFDVPASAFLKKSSKGYCYPSITSNSVGSALTLGDVFLKNFYALFSVEKLAVGLAVPAPKPAS